MKAYKVVVMENEEGRFGPWEILTGEKKAKYFFNKEEANEYANKYTAAFYETYIVKIEIK